ncbi:pentapeptide repeat-containing protein [Bacillus atrophaeus]|uniref:pentapeptide repeat-containing protein n=1 Tax=Bacillus atrophaeus TaxID=1452 RepID=UPI002282EE93|nr:pentapeptide repeat-containing protein [Bacillus atrophaeus]MCY9166391.1 pentapeptide repeat-containing protein [Bacillus atrophaeus]
MGSFLQSDCDNCFGLCCVALPYAKSADFAFNKDGGEPCRNLLSDHRCNIHDQLREKGFRGCVSYECFGAGQHVSQHIYHGDGWRHNPKQASEIFTVYPIVQQLHEMLSYLSQALDLKETQLIQTEIKNIYHKTITMTNLPPKEILELDIPSHREIVNKILVMTSELVRKDFIQNQQNTKTLKGLDYLGANLKGVNLQGANLRGVLFIATNLRNADLRKADFIGADLRDADLSGANLTGAIFLTQSQINSAKGNRQTKLPFYINTPELWLS